MLAKGMKKYILEYVMMNGKYWKALSKKLHKVFPSFEQLNSKRLAYIYENYLDPKCKNSIWTQDEEIYLIKNVEELLSSGVKCDGLFSRLKNENFHTRSRNDIKNKYYTKFNQYLSRVLEDKKAKGNNHYEEQMLEHARFILTLYSNKQLSVTSHLFSIINKFNIDIDIELGYNSPKPTFPQQRRKIPKLAIKDPVCPQPRTFAFVFSAEDWEQTLASTASTASNIQIYQPVGLNNNSTSTPTIRMGENSIPNSNYTILLSLNLPGPWLYDMNSANKEGQNLDDNICLRFLNYVGESSIINNREEGTRNKEQDTQTV